MSVNCGSVWSQGMKSKELIFFCLKLNKTIYNLQSTTSEFTTQDCRELGFIKSQLMCSSCEKLDDFGLEEIK